MTPDRDTPLNGSSVQSKPAASAPLASHRSCQVSPGWPLQPVQQLGQPAPPGLVPGQARARVGEQAQQPPRQVFPALPRLPPALLAGPRLPCRRPARCRRFDDLGGIGGAVADRRCHRCLPAGRRGAEQRRQHLGPVAGRRRGRRPGLPGALPLVMGQDVGDDLVRGRRGIDLGRGDVGVPEDPLHVGEGQVRVADHSLGGAVPQVMQRPVRAEQPVDPGEHHPGRVVGQRPERAAQRPPHRLVRPSRDQVQHLLLVEAQPDERVRRGGQVLQRPAALADHADRLLLRGEQALDDAQQLGGAGAGGDVERDQRPVPVAGQPGEQVVERLVGDAPRRRLGLLRLVCGPS